MTKPFKTICRNFFIASFIFLTYSQAHAGMTITIGLLNLNPHALPEEVPAGHSVHDITFNQATQLLYSFLTKDTFFYAAKKYGYSGLLSKQTLNTIVPTESGDALTSGLLFFLCRDIKNETDQTDDELFLAYRRVTDFESNVSVPVPAEEEDFYKTNSLLKYENEEMPNLRDVKTSLITSFNTADNENDKVKGDYVLACSNAFKLYKAMDEISTRDVLCNDYSFGFIPLGELNSLRLPPNVDQQDFSGIRFYFGFDDTENINRIRVFFVGSLNNKNYIIADDREDKTQYARIIERSRP